MNKLLLFLLTLLAITFSACDDDTSDYPDTATAAFRTGGTSLLLCDIG